MAGFAAPHKLEGHRTEAGRLDAPAGRVGIAFAKQDRHDYNWRVTAIQPWSPFHGRLAPGQQLLGVDGNRVSTKTVQEVSALLKGDPGSAVTLFVSSHADAPRAAPVFADTL